VTRGLALAVALGLGAVPAAAETAAAQQVRPAGARTELRRELDAEIDRMERDFARGDMLAVARRYADDAQMIPPDGPPVVGRAAIDRFWTDLKHPRMWRLETLDWGGGDDEAWQLVRSTLAAGTGTGVRPETVRCLLIWRRRPGGPWRIHLDIWTEEERPWNTSHR
jgi:ketosteroid isomerase-like protein